MRIKVKASLYVDAFTKCQDILVFFILYPKMWRAGNQNYASSSNCTLFIWKCVNKAYVYRCCS